MMAPTDPDAARDADADEPADSPFATRDSAEAEGAPSAHRNTHVAGNKQAAAMCGWMGIDAPDAETDLATRSGAEAAASPGTSATPEVPADRYATVEPGTSDAEAPRPPGMRPPSLPGYEIAGELGRGGMGVVYRALDQRRGQAVALKTLRGLHPAALVRFKQEFRALADVAHPNLVSLYELVSDGTEWCFTMEIVEGVDLLSYIRHGDQTRRPRTFGTPVAPLAAPEQWQRLRNTLAQLALGLQALHAADKLHRDVKPSNALVNGDGRVVLLDFGLVAEVGRAGRSEGPGAAVVGTIAYMSPEQAAARPVSPATDWYSVGVILYEALTGRLPFTGPVAQLLHDKARLDPPATRTLVRHVPRDLDALCTDLLSRDPEARPDGREVLRRLRPQNVAAPGPLPTAHPSGELLGRESHLRVLHESFQAVCVGRTAIVHLSGPPGVGKSALVEAFLDGLSRSRGVVVLAGQCYEKESVPYKAFDKVVDELSQYLAGLLPWELQAIVPRDVLPLARVFPTLGRLVAAAPARHGATPPDPQEMRRRAFAALRELLARLADRRPLVLAIDDLQWGDLDSLALYFELLRPPEPPRLLLVAAYRSDEIPTSPFLQGLLASPDPLGAAVERYAVAVEPLSEAEGRELALRLLPAKGMPSVEAAAAIAHESGGNPFFIAELAQHAGAASGPGASPAPRSAVSLLQALWARIERLPAGPRRLLEVLAIAGRPLRVGDAAEAAGVAAAEREAVSTLRVHRLARGTGGARAELLTTYHDRVRETVAANLSPNRTRECHRRLAETLEATGSADPESLALHFQEAGLTERARAYFVRAADKAAAALAFDRAARFYHAALAALPAGDAAEQPLRVKLAEALANARRGAEAAPVYLRAAGAATALASLDLRRRAAEQYIASGHIDEGLDVLRDVLAAMGMRLPATPLRALLSIAYYRFRIWLRGLGFRERPASRLSADELVRIDTCWSLGLGLVMVDPFRGLAFQSRCLLLALNAGEPHRIVRALGLEIGHSSTGGGRSRRRTAEVFRVARALAERLQDPHGLGMVWLGGGVAAYFEGRWRDARELCDRAVEVLRSRCTGVAHELNEAHFHAIRALEFLGELKELSQRLPALLQDAATRGDRYAATNLRTRLSFLVSLMQDDPGRALTDVREAMAQWSQRDFHLQHYFEVTTHTDICHYRGDAAAAWRLLEDRWPRMVRSLLMRVQVSYLTLLYLRGRSAVALAAVPHTPPRERDRLLCVAERCAVKMEREHMPWSDPQALLIRAAVAAIRGDRAAAEQRLRDAEAGFTAADMRLYAAATARRRGQLIGGEAGHCLQEKADHFMHGQVICDPARWSGMYVAGFGGDDRQFQ